MAMASPMNERRHLPDRRMSGSAAAMSMPSGSAYASMEQSAAERSQMKDRTGTVRTGARSRMNAIDWIAMALLIVGGLNWGLMGLFQFDLVARLFGDMTAVSRTIYALVGLSALYCIYTGSKMSRRDES